MVSSNTIEHFHFLLVFSVLLFFSIIWTTTLIADVMCIASEWYYGSFVLWSSHGVEWIQCKSLVLLDFSIVALTYQMIWILPLQILSGNAGKREYLSFFPSSTSPQSIPYDKRIFYIIHQKKGMWLEFKNSWPNKECFYWFAYDIAGIRNWGQPFRR